MVESGGGTSKVLTAPDGTTVETTLGRDPRFGMLSPIVTRRVVTTPGGRTLTVEGSRTVVLADPEDPLSVEALTDAVTIGARTWTTSYDAASATITATTPTGIGSVLVLDALGRPLSRRHATLERVLLGYDAFGRLESVEQGAGPAARVTTFGYDPGEGWLTDVLDAEEQPWSLTPDAVGRVVASTRPDGESVALTYDEESNVIGVTPPGSFEHSFTYDPDGMMTSYSAPDPDAGTPAEQIFGYHYDLDHRLTRVDLADGVSAITLGYDADTHRLASVTWPLDGVPVTTGLEYDDDDDGLNEGRLVGLTSTEDVDLSFTWDGLLPLSTTWSGAVSGTVSYDYDESLRVSQVNVAGTVIDVEYTDDDQLSRVGSLTVTPNGTTGLLESTALGWVSDSFAPTSFGELEEHRSLFGADELFRESFVHDDLGRIRQVTESVEGGAPEVRAYTYDGAQRLETVTVDGVLTETFEYDAKGNRLTYDTLIPGETCAAEYDEQDRIERCTVAGGPSVSWTWDAFGSLASYTDGTGTTSYTYDVLGNLREVVLPSGDVITYTIDAANRRVGRSVNGVFDRGWLYGDALNPVAELDSTGAVRAVFVYGTRGRVPDYMIRLDEGGEEYRLVTDVRGSVRLVVRASDGEVVQRLDYDEWGRVLRDTNPGYQPFGYAGGLYDPATGLVRFGARDYDARVGRWTARDPRYFSRAPLEVGLYVYVSGDPLNFVDLQGTYDWPVSWIVFGAAGILAGASIAIAVAYPPSAGYLVPAAVVFGFAGVIAGGIGLYETISGANILGRIGSEARSEEVRRTNEEIRRMNRESGAATHRGVRSPTPSMDEDICEGDNESASERTGTQSELRREIEREGLID